jgi:arylsulfatase A
MNTGIHLPLIALGVSALIGEVYGQESEPTPNVIIFFADDYGWPQSGAYGSDYYHTPNIDRLAAEGVRFTDAYSAAAICSPTRASIMTGKYPASLNITDFIPGNRRDIYPLTQPEMQQFLPLEERTLGNLFSDHGYNTAMFGKWHLSPVKFGPESLPYYPDKQGFTHQFVIDKPDQQSNPQLDPHWSDMIGDTSVDFIRENANNPFFLFLSFSAIHDPLIERADSIAMWRNKPGSEKPENNPIIAAMLSRMDRNVGKVLDVLDELKLSENTIVVFYSDNGGLAENNVVYYMHYYPEGEQMRIAKQTPLRKGKGWLYEGGIRVPLVIRWQSVIDKGWVSNEVVSSYDFMPTFCELFETTPAPGIDGVSFLAHLRTGEQMPERNHYWHYPHYHNQTGMSPGGAIRSGKWKLIEWYEKSILDAGEPAYELYDLENDIGESVDLSQTEKEITKKLSEMLAEWRREVNAQMPVPNPNY